MSSIKLDGLTLASTANSKAVLDNAVVFPSGHIIQVHQSVKLDADSTQSSVNSGGSGVVNITGTDQNGSGSIFCCKITPKQSTSKILVNAVINVGGDNASYTYLELFRDSSSIYVGDASTNRFRTSAMSFDYETNEGVVSPLPIKFLDSPTIPSTPIEIVYSIKYGVASSADGDSTATINKSFRDYAAVYYDPRTPSSITLMEVSQ